MARSTEDLKATQVAYWNTRTRKRKVNQEKYTNKQIQELLKYYRESLRQLDRMVKEAYDKYSSDTGLGITELIGVLTGVERKEFLNKVKGRMEILGLVPEDIYNQKMLSRITRVEALKEQAYWEMRRLQAMQEIKTTSILNNTMEHSYDLIMKDYVGDDYKPGVFTRFNPGLPEQVLREKWSGKNYSKRVWGKERNKMAKELPFKIAGAMVSGQSYQRTALEIRKDYNVMQWEAMRLVRTESAFVDGQANKRAMLDIDITQYTLDVTLDSRTSDICNGIDETEVFNYEDAVVGENFQPFHPNCRTVDSPLTSSESLENAREKFSQRMEEIEEEEEEEEVVSSEKKIYPSGYKSAFDYILAKQGAKVLPGLSRAEGPKGTYTLAIDETDTKIFMHAIGTKEKGTGLGTEIMNQLKEYADSTKKVFTVVDVYNEKFFDKFKWLEKKDKDTYMYSPLDKKIRNQIKKDIPLNQNKKEFKEAEANIKKILSQINDKDLVRLAGEENINTDNLRGGTWLTNKAGAEQILDAMDPEQTSTVGIGGSNVYKAQSITIKNPLIIEDAILNDGSFSVINSGYENFIRKAHSESAETMWREAQELDGEGLTGVKYQKKIDEIIRKALENSGFYKGSKEVEGVFKELEKNKFDSAMDLIIGRGLEEQGYDALILREGDQEHVFHLRGKERKMVKLGTEKPKEKGA